MSCFCPTLKKSMSKESFGWLVNLTSRGLTLTMRTIIYFTSRAVNSQNVGQKNGFKPIK